MFVILILIFMRKAGTFPRVRHLSVTPLLGMLLALPPNIRQGWKDLPRTNTLTYVALLIEPLTRKADEYYARVVATDSNKHSSLLLSGGTTLV